MMLDQVPVHIGRLAALVGVLVSLCVVMALSGAASASAEQYCWGANLSNENSCSSGHTRFASEVKGMGSSHSVCVAIQPFGPIRCSSGPGVWVTNNYGTNLEGQGWIADNAKGATTVFGEIF
jgi:hypothetical protein